MATLLTFWLPWMAQASGARVCEASAGVAGEALQHQLRTAWADTWLRRARSERVWLAVSRERGMARVVAGDPPAVRREFVLRDRAGRALHFECAWELPSRHSMVLHFQEPVVWELFMAANAPVVYEGMVHDFRMGEALGEPAEFPVRQIALPFPAAILSPVPARPEVIIAGESPAGRWQIGLMNLDVRRMIGVTALAEPPQAAGFFCQGTARIVAVSDRKGGRVLLQLPGFMPVAALPENYSPCGGE